MTSARIRALVVLLIAALTLSACTSGGDTAESTPAPTRALGAAAGAFGSAADLVRDNLVRLGALTSSRDLASSAGRLSEQAAEARAAAVAKAKAAKIKAAKIKAAKVKAAKVKAAKVKAAKVKAAKAKAAKVKAAKVKAAKARAAKAKAARAAKAAREQAARRKALMFDPLTGGRRSHHPVIAVKIDNTSAGRPQFGIGQADVVYVEQVEGGLTRLIGVFHSQLPTEVGPVRSVRSTDVELLPSYGTPVLAFSGGAGGPLAMLAKSRLIDGSGLGAYWRSSAKRAPYNMHVNLKQLASTDAAKKAKVTSPGFKFGTKYRALASAPSVGRIQVTMGAGHTGFAYNAGTGKYRVANAGVPAVDAAGRAVVTDNVLVQHVIDVPDGTVDSVGAPSYLTHTTGKGDFTLYRNGKAIEGRWFRFDKNGPTKFFNSHGKPVKFARGRTWVTLVPQNGSVDTQR